ncbi:MAG: hypothetical protein Q7S00_04205 [bacterium]|nr:hypothetical protein [bacterium]
MGAPVKTHIEVQKVDLELPVGTPAGLLDNSVSEGFSRDVREERKEQGEKARNEQAKVEEQRDEQGREQTREVLGLKTRHVYETRGQSPDTRLAGLIQDRREVAQRGKEPPPSVQPPKDLPKPNTLAQEQLRQNAQQLAENSRQPPSSLFQSVVQTFTGFFSGRPTPPAEATPIVLQEAPKQAPPAPKNPLQQIIDGKPAVAVAREKGEALPTALPKGSVRVFHAPADQVGEIPEHEMARQMTGELAKLTEPKWVHAEKMKQSQPVTPQGTPVAVAVADQPRTFAEVRQGRFSSPPKGGKTGPLSGNAHGKRDEEVSEEELAILSRGGIDFA